MFESIKCRAVYHDSLRDEVTTVAEYLPDGIPSVDTSYVMFVAGADRHRVIAEIFTTVEGLGRYTVMRRAASGLRPIIVDSARLIRS